MSTTQTTDKANKHTAEVRAQFGRVQYDGRSFYVVEAGASSVLAQTLGCACGPWAVIENNGGRMTPIVIRGGISGSRANAIRVMEREVSAISKAEKGAQ